MRHRTDHYRTYPLQNEIFVFVNKNDLPVDTNIVVTALVFLYCKLYRICLCDDVRQCLATRAELAPLLTIAWELVIKNDILASHQRT